MSWFVYSESVVVSAGDFHIWLLLLILYYFDHTSYQNLVSLLPLNSMTPCICNMAYDQCCLHKLQTGSRWITEYFLFCKFFFLTWFCFTFVWSLPCFIKIISQSRTIMVKIECIFVIITWTGERERGTGKGNWKWGED